MTTQIRKRMVKLPSDIKTLLGSASGEVRDDYVRNLRRAGWTLQAISEAIDVSRERVRQICVMPDTGTDMAEQFPVPTPPIVEPRAKKQYQEPNPEVLARILELQPYAQQVRANSSRFREQAEEYTKLLNDVRLSGVSLYRMSKRLGVTHGALRFRLTRYGYMASPENSSSKVYSPIRKENRVI